MINKLIRVDNLYSIDLECNKVSEYVPDDVETVFFQMYLDVIDIKTGEECEFQLDIATPKGLVNVASLVNENLINTRGMLIYKSYDYKELVSDIEKIVDDCSQKANFHTTLIRLERFFLSEREGL